MISQTPTLPAAVQLSAPITLVISKGPQLFRVPDVYKDTPEAAQAELEQANLKVKFNRQFATGGHVLHQSVPAGSYRRRGTVVTVDIF